MWHVLAWASRRVARGRRKFTSVDIQQSVVNNESIESRVCMLAAATSALELLLSWSINSTPYTRNRWIIVNGFVRRSVGIGLAAAHAAQAKFP